jgi:hypothetical protein
MADTWDANADNQLCTGNAVRDGATATGLWSITTTIPSELNKRILTKAQLATYTNISTTSTPLGQMSSNECPTKDEILGTF